MIIGAAGARSVAHDMTVISMVKTGITHWRVAKHGLISIIVAVHHVDVCVGCTVLDMIASTTGLHCMPKLGGQSCL